MGQVDYLVDYLRPIGSNRPTDAITTHPSKMAYIEFMELRSREIACLILVTVISSAGAQPIPAPVLGAVTKRLGILCNQIAETDKQEREVVQNHHSPALFQALKSEKEFWRFVIDQSTVMWTD